jgi:anti-anti-sigma factor
MSTTLSLVTALTQLHLDTTWPSPTTARVAVVGEVDLATAHLLRDRLLDVLREQAPAVVDVDLAGVTFLDCTALSALVAARNAAVHAECQVRVSRPQPIVRRVLEVTGLLGAFTAPIDQPQPLPTGSERPARTARAGAVAAGAGSAHRTGAQRPSDLVQVA